MRLCSTCGSSLPEDALFCPVCGAAVLPVITDTPADPGDTVPAGLGSTAPAPDLSAPGPHYNRTEPQQPDGGLTTAQYFWLMLLFAVPLVGLGFMLYWSFGSTAAPAVRRFARASLIKTGIFTVLGVLAAAAVAAFAAWYGARLYSQSFGMQYGGPGWYEDDGGWYDWFGAYGDYGGNGEYGDPSVGV